MGEWQDIESAPRDGTDIDLWCAPVRRKPFRVADAYWYEGRWWAPNWGDEGDDGVLPHDYNATHWQPLPEPPHPSRCTERGEKA